MQSKCNHRAGAAGLCKATALADLWHVVCHVAVCSGRPTAPTATNAQPWPASCADTSIDGQCVGTCNAGFGTPSGSTPPSVQCVADPDDSTKGKWAATASGSCVRGECSTAAARACRCTAWLACAVPGHLPSKISDSLACAGPAVLIKEHFQHNHCWSVGLTSTVPPTSASGACRKQPVKQYMRDYRMVSDDPPA